MRDSGRLRVVAIGGGTGLASVLRGLKAYPYDITAVVTMADDGGSSGRLRKDMGMLPPGDIRDCLLALANTEPVMASLFNHRFTKGELSGHSFGNLFLAAVTEMTGDFQVAVKTMSQILAVRGKVLPATLCDVTLCAEMDDGTVVNGEFAIPAVRKRVRKLSLVPPTPEALGEAVQEILQAHLIIIGPGSLFTSIIPNLLVPGIREAIACCRARKLYVCNVMTQPGETDGFTASDHVKAIQEHAGRLFTQVLVDTSTIPFDMASRYSAEGRFPVLPDQDTLASWGYRTITGRFLTGKDLARHDSTRLGHAIAEFLAGETGRMEKCAGKAAGWCSCG